MKKLILALLFPFFTFSQWNTGDLYHYGLDNNLQMGSATAISSNGNVAAISALYNVENYEGMPKNAGYVDVFHLFNGVWTQKGNRIKGSLFGENSGTAISLNSDGSIIAIGSPNANATTTADGRVRIFQFNGTDWEILGNIITGNQQYAGLGVSLCLNETGSTVVIGAPNANINGVYLGKAIIYELVGTQWTQKGNSIFGTANEDLFGISSAINAQGNTIIVGADNNDTGGSNKGKASVYKFNSGFWELVGQDLFGETIDGNFGKKVIINNLGNLIAISEPFFGANSNQYGRTKIYENINNVWVQKGSSITGVNIGDLSGFSLSFNGDGSQIAIGEIGFNNSGVDKGRIRILKFENNDWVNYSSILGNENSAYFGNAISLSALADKIVVGVPRSNSQGTWSGYGVIYAQPTLNITSSIENIHFKIFPNPVSNIVNVQNNQNTNFLKIEIVDNLNRIVFQKGNTNGKDIELNVSFLTAGIYYLKVYNNSTSSIKKFIKN